MIDNRSPRQLHENATGVPKEGREVYQLTEQNAVKQPKLDIGHNIINRNNELRSLKKNRNPKKGLVQSWERCSEMEQNCEEIYKPSTLDELQQVKSKTNLEVKKNEEDTLNGKENSLARSKPRKADQIALMLLETYDFCDSMHASN